MRILKQVLLITLFLYNPDCVIIASHACFENTNESLCALADRTNRLNTKHFVLSNIYKTRNSETYSANWAKKCAANTEKTQANNWNCESCTTMCIHYTKNWHVIRSSVIISEINTPGDTDNLLINMFITFKIPRKQYCVFNSVIVCDMLLFLKWLVFY